MERSNQKKKKQEECVADQQKEWQWQQAQNQYAKADIKRIKGSQKLCTCSQEEEYRDKVITWVTTVVCNRMFKQIQVHQCEEQMSLAQVNSSVFGDVPVHQP